MDLISSSWTSTIEPGPNHFLIDLHNSADAASGIPDISRLDHSLGLPATAAGAELESVLDGYDRIWEKRLEDLRASRL
jgi:hypothetical protein